MIRVAAGVAVVFAITTAGGPGTAVTSADPGSSRSPSGHSSDGGQSRGDGGQRDRRQGPGGSDGRGNDRGGNDGRDRNGGDRRGSNRQDDTRTPSGDGWRGSDRPSRSSSWGDDDESTGITAGRGPSSAAAVQTATASRSMAVASDTPAVAAETPTDANVPTVATASAPDTAPTVASTIPTSGGGGGVVADAATSAPVVAPKVTFGDGRSPGLLSQRPGEPPAQMGPEPTIAQPLPAVPASPAPTLLPMLPMLPMQPTQTALVRPLTMESTPWPLSETPVTSFWGKAQLGWPVSVLFGIVGLLLAPIGGVWLGYRQARAAKSASDLVAP
jgi:hypothetical protein